jgi:NADPH2:quinone reductase
MNLPQRMSYIEASGAGEPDILHLAVGPVPKPKPDEVLIRVFAAGVNRPDVLQRKGLYPLPFNANPIIGLEVAGEVVAIGEKVAELKPGDRICALTNGGGYAEYCTVPALQCLPWPEDYDDIRAAALPETYFTVWANIFQIGHLALGESLLVHGGTSGIGVTAIQLASEFGCRIYATAGSQEKCNACIKLGADAAINYHEANFAEGILELTSGWGVDVVLDMVGAPYTISNLRCLAMDGRLIQIGTMQGSIVENFDLTYIMMHRLVVTGSAMRPRTIEEKGRIAKELRDTVWPVLDAGRCGPVIHKVFPLGEAAAAHRLMESSAHIGKIVLKVST